MTDRRYGWRRDTPDARDQVLHLSPLAALLPARVDLRPGMPPVYDQGALGSCTANALAAAVEYCERRQPGGPDVTPSRLFVYYNERSLEGTVGWDAGAQLRDGVKALNRWGWCAETSWPYVVERFAVKPYPLCYRQAEPHRVAQYRRVPQAEGQLKAVLAAGFPVVFGFSVYESLETAEVTRTGDVPLPAADERLLGGHAVLLCGYDDATERFAIRNSWGEGWGDQGYGTLAYEYLLDPHLAADFWAVTLAP